MLRGEKKLNYILELLKKDLNVIIKMLNVENTKMEMSKVIIQMVSIQKYILTRLITSIVVAYNNLYNII